MIRILACLMLITALGCGHHRNRERVHSVVQGDTLSGIAKQYDSDIESLMRKNRLASANRLSIGQKLLIPFPDEVFLQPAPKAEKIAKVAVPPKQVPKKTKNPKWSELKGKSKYIWPVHGVVTALYGSREGMKQEGLTIAARLNTVIWASADGKVLYAGEQSGYGQILIIRHAGDMVSIYAHNDGHIVKEGDDVKQGQPIAWVGQSGGATAPGLHFELRQGQKTLNPLRHLP